MPTNEKYGQMSTEVEGNPGLEARRSQVLSSLYRFIAVVLMIIGLALLVGKFVGQTAPSITGRSFMQDFDFILMLCLVFLPAIILNFMASGHSKKSKKLSSNEADA